MLARLGRLNPTAVFCACVLIILSLFEFFSNVSTQSGHKDTESCSQPLYSDTPSVLDDSGTVIDDTQENGPRIRQASMMFGQEDNTVFERSLKTHIQHAMQWGYPTHILRQDAVGRGVRKTLLFDKILYLESLVINEMAKPYGRRSEWIM